MAGSVAGDCAPSHRVAGIRGGIDGARTVSRAGFCRATRCGVGRPAKLITIPSTAHSTLYIATMGRFVANNAKPFYPHCPQDTAPSALLSPIRAQDQTPPSRPVCVLQCPTTRPTNTHRFIATHHPFLSLLSLGAL